VVPPSSHTVSRVVYYFHLADADFVYAGFTLSAADFQLLLLSLSVNYWLGSSPFARHYLGNLILISFPPLTKMFQFSGYRVSFLILFWKEQYHINGIRLPHSEIPGSELICSLPRLIAAYHVLLRLLAPRHSLCALYSLIPFSNSIATSLLRLRKLCFGNRVLY
jgi:hypothetical protein